MRVLEFVGEIQEFSVLNTKFSVLEKGKERRILRIGTRILRNTIFPNSGIWYSQAKN